MTFSNEKAIYIQMADRLCDDILAGVYHADDRVPSVREYAVTLEVNNNTAMKAYDLLARENIIYNKRGLGYFVKAGAREHIMRERRKNFIEQQLPDFFRNMKMLDINIDKIIEEWKKQL